MDALAVQHATWIARRLHRCLNHFNSPPSERPRTQFSIAKHPSRGRRQKFQDGIRQPASSRAPTPRASRPGRESKPNTAAASVPAIFPGGELSQHFEQELDADADARADFSDITRQKFGGRLGGLSIRIAMETPVRTFQMEIVPVWE